jgi:hypothetical protein
MGFWDEIVKISKAVKPKVKHPTWLDTVSSVKLNTVPQELMQRFHKNDDTAPFFIRQYLQKGISPNYVQDGSPAGATKDFKEWFDKNAHPYLKEFKHEVTNDGRYNEDDLEGGHVTLGRYFPFDENIGRWGNEEGEPSWDMYEPSPRRIGIYDSSQAKRDVYGTRGLPSTTAGHEFGHMLYDMTKGYEDDDFGRLASAYESILGNEYDDADTGGILYGYGLNQLYGKKGDVSKVLNTPETITLPQAKQAAKMARRGQGNPGFWQHVLEEYFRQELPRVTHKALRNPKNVMPYLEKKHNDEVTDWNDYYGGES